MDCPICSDAPIPNIIRLLKYPICPSCYEGARAFMTMVKKLDNNNTNSSKDSDEDLKDQLAFLAGFVQVFRDQIHTDIEVKPDTCPCSLFAHKALLAARSALLKGVLNVDNEEPTKHLSLPKLNHNKLEAFLEFLYSRSLPREKMEKHIYSLSLAADKYEVSFLQKFCDQHMLRTLNLDNALDILDIACTCSCFIVKNVTLRFIVQNMREIVFAPKFYGFPFKNPHLAVQITRASCWKKWTLDSDTDSLDP